MFRYGLICTNCDIRCLFSFDKRIKAATLKQTLSGLHRKTTETRIIAMILGMRKTRKKKIN